MILKAPINRGIRRVDLKQDIQYVIHLKIEYNNFKRLKQKIIKQMIM